MLVFERRVPHSSEKVWRTVTQPGLLDLWFPAHIEMDFRVGGRMTFAFMTNDIVPPPGTVTDLSAPTVFEFEWGGDLLRFDLQGDNEGCAVTFLYTFADRSEAAKSAAGWHVCLDALEAVLRDELPAPPWDRWAALYEEYCEVFGTVRNPETA